MFSRWVRFLLIAVAAGIVAAPAPAHAWRHWGWGPGIVVGIPPPVVVAPPGYYYAPPPAYYYAPPPAGQACYAGPYVCPLDQPGPFGAPCSCPTNTGRAGGRIG
jgi:hypothetical protein